MYTIEEFDRAKTQVLKYVMYKKRTLQEVKNKFATVIEENLLEDVLQELQEIGYINDEQYIERAVNEYRALKNLFGTLPQRPRPVGAAVHPVSYCAGGDER